MRVLRLSLQLTVFCMVFLFIACASTTQFSTIWKDETYQGHPEKILVINSFPNPAARRIFEDEFVSGLKERGIDAVMSYTIMPAPIVSDKDAIVAKAKEVNADAVLLSSSSGPKMDEIGNRYITTQTEVYNMKSNKLIFSATAKIELQQATPYLNEIQSNVKDLLNQLLRLGLI